ncbi:MAG: hypothetical protein JXR76_07725 [Deltaproteobacteria bacterium]|nr:hypothetical protein [Deltaproteobacteria bacterium]
MEISNLKGLSNAAMIGATGGWVDPAQERPMLEGIPEVAGFVPTLDKARDNLIAMQLSGEMTATEQRLKELNDAAVNQDATFDRLARGVHGIFSATACLVGESEAEGQRLLRLRTVLFPDGLLIVNRSYIEEAGSIEMAKGRLTEDDRAFLDTFPCVGGTILTRVDEWFEAGVVLGGLERDRSQLAEASESAEVVSKSDMMVARNQWIRVVRAILAGLALSEKAGENTVTTILQPLKKAVARLGAKSSGNKEVLVTEES